MKCPSSTGIRESERFGTPPGRASSITRAGKEEGGSNSKYRGGRVSSLSVLRARQSLLDGPMAPLSPGNPEQPQVTGACRRATMYIGPCLRQCTVTSVQGRVYGRVARDCGIASSWPPEAKSPTGAEHLTQLAARRGQGALDLKTSDLDQQGTSSVPSRAAHKRGSWPETKQTL